VDAGITAAREAYNASLPPEPTPEPVDERRLGL
jgi:hypothetical protein